MKLVYVRFLDHVIFRGARLRVKPVVRETIGWLLEKSDSSITLLWVENLETVLPK